MKGQEHYTGLSIMECVTSSSHGFTDTLKQKKHLLYVEKKNLTHIMYLHNYLKTRAEY